MTNPYMSYYMRQSGSGLATYRGRRNQRGHGLGGVLSGLIRTIAPAVMPIAKQVGRETLAKVKKTALREGVGLIGDVLLRGQNPKAAATRRLKNAGRGAVSDLMSSVRGAIKRKAPAQRTRPAKARCRDGRAKKNKTAAGRRRKRAGGIIRDIFG